MSLRQKTSVMLLGILIGVSMASAAETPPATPGNRKLNFVFILVDDLGWRDLSCYGSPFYETPNLDKLATQSMRFTDAYAACNVCSPSRASILTGKYPATVGVTDFIGAGRRRGAVQSAPYVHYLPLTEKTIASSLRDAGYATWHVGKWHLGSKPYWPQHHGFDVNIAGTDNGGTKSFFSPYSNPMLTDGPKGEFLPDRLTDEAIKLIKANKATGKPFFLNMWHFLVHIPIQPKPEYVPKYVEKAKRMGLDQKKAVVLGEYDHVSGNKDKRMWVREFQSSPQYAAFIQSLDESVGRLLKTLDEEGLADNTVVIFTSDNGGASTHDCSTSNAPLKYGKGWTYDGGVREPLMIRWPGKIAPNTTCSVPVTSPDFYPTILQMAGLPLMPEQHQDGVSLMPLLEGSDHLEREAIFWHYPHYSAQGGAPASAVRSGDYKLIHFFEDDHLELYNLRTDIGEEHNLAQENPDLARKLNTMLEGWLAKVGAKIPQRNPEFKASEYPWTREVQPGLIVPMSQILTTPPQTATASNVNANQIENYGPDNAVDGDLTTRWATDNKQTQAWLEVEMREARTFDRVKISEGNFAGRVKRFEVQYQDGEQWKTIVTGTGIGSDYTAKFAPVTAHRLRLNILESGGGPTIAEFQALPVH